MVVTDLGGYGGVLMRDAWVCLFWYLFSMLACGRFASCRVWFVCYLTVCDVLWVCGIWELGTCWLRVWVLYWLGNLLVV